MFDLLEFCLFVEYLKLKCRLIFIRKSGQEWCSLYIFDFFGIIIVQYILLGDVLLTTNLLDMTMLT